MAKSRQKGVDDLAIEGIVLGDEDLEAPDSLVLDAVCGLVDGIDFRCE